MLVTGGAGFVGSHLCAYLVKRGDHVSITLPFTVRSDKASSVCCTASLVRNVSASDPPCLHTMLFRHPAASVSPVAPSALLAGLEQRRRSPGPTQVICVDNFFTGSKDNIAQLIGKPNFELIRHDITERLVLEVDQIFHLACPASPVHYK